MSGHSKWHSIKHKKAAADAKRGKVFTRIIKEIVIAARLGGGDPEGNPRLRTAIAAARDANMPKENIERAIKKGTGELPGTTIEEWTYEGYGAGGVAFMVEVTTDNRNRTTSDIRHAFSKHNGSLGESGCVAWMFERKGQIVADGEGRSEDAMMELALECGADDLTPGDEGMYVLTTDPAALMDVREALEAKGVKVVSAEVNYVPKNTVKVEGKEAEQVLKLLSVLEDHEDVQKVSANFEIDDAVLAQFE
ncbi:MAG: YebC/PmpR family DNA-binding transcriptional regulator [Candidatus Sumerlaeia bacterium]